MPRTTAAIATTHKSAVLAHALADVLPMKAIAGEVGLSESFCRRILWAFGVRTMLVTAEERAHLRERRRATPAPTRLAA
jgi:hypothetical protein